VRCFANDNLPPQALSVFYTPATANDGSVVAHLVVNEAIITPEGRTKVSDTYFTRVYEQDVSERVELEDRTGNKGSEKILIDWIGTRYTAEGYVADGLIVHLDGIKNLGASHATTTLTWEDLTVNDNDFQLFGSSLPNFTDKAVSFDGTSQYAKSVKPLQLSPYEAVTVEVLYRQPQGVLKG
jgi:hypothetical protein